MKKVSFSADLAPPVNMEMEDEPREDHRFLLQKRLPRAGGTAFLARHAAGCRQRTAAMDGCLLSRARAYDGMGRPPPAVRPGRSAGPGTGTGTGSIHFRGRRRHAWPSPAVRARPVIVSMDGIHARLRGRASASTPWQRGRCANLFLPACQCRKTADCTRR